MNAVMIGFPEPVACADASRDAGPGSAGLAPTEG